MKAFTIILPAVIFVATAFLSLPPAQTATTANPAVSSMEKKLQHVVSNGKAAHPDPSPTEFTDQEINAYFSAGKVKLPVGVQSVHFRSQPGVVTANAQVDFDQIRAGRNAGNPLLAIFTGIHTVTVVAHAHGSDGEGFVEVDSVVLDDTEIPPILLQLLIQKFVRPKYPDIGLDSRFALPDRIDTAIVGLQDLTLAQK